MAKNSEVNTVIKQLEKAHGEGIIQNLSDEISFPTEHIPTGLYTVDHEVLGIGGLPKGRMVEMYGANSGGKTTLLLTLIASAQKLYPDKKCAIIDFEHALDPKWMEKNGVNVDELLVSQPDTAEIGFEIVEELTRTGQFSIIGIDSIAAGVPKAILDGDFSEANIGLRARLLSTALLKFTGITSKTNTILVFINQTRENLNIGFGGQKSRNTTGGQALKFYVSVRLEIDRVKTIKFEDEAEKNEVKIKCVKNKVAPPFRETIVELLYDSGFDKLGNIVDAAIDKKIISQAGAWYNYEDQKWQGKDAVKEYFKDKQDKLLAKIKGSS